MRPNKQGPLQTRERWTAVQHFPVCEGHFTVCCGIQKFTWCSTTFFGPRRDSVRMPYSKILTSWRYFFFHFLSKRPQIFANQGLIRFKFGPAYIQMCYASLYVASVHHINWTKVTACYRGGTSTSQVIGCLHVWRAVDTITNWWQKLHSSHTVDQTAKSL